MSKTNIGTRTKKHFEQFLSAAQLGVWVAQKINPASPMFNLGQYIEIRGSVNPVLLDQALRQVVDESDALRVGFVAADDDPQQVVYSSLDWTLTTIDFSRDADAIRAALAWMRADLSRPINLLRDPLFRFAVLRLSATRLFWYQRYHHVLNDGFGGWLIARRVGEIYTSLAWIIHEFEDKRSLLCYKHVI